MIASSVFTFSTSKMLPDSLHVNCPVHTKISLSPCSLQGRGSTRAPRILIKLSKAFQKDDGTDFIQLTRRFWTMISGFERFLKYNNPLRALLQLGLIVSHEFCLQFHKYCFKLFCPKLCTEQFDRLGSSLWWSFSSWAWLRLSWFTSRLSIFPSEIARYKIEREHIFSCIFIKDTRATIWTKKTGCRNISTCVQPASTTSRCGETSSGRSCWQLQEVIICAFVFVGFFVLVFVFVSVFVFIFPLANLVGSYSRR